MPTDPTPRAGERFTAFAGMRIIESVYAVKSGEPVEVARTWRERLLSADAPGPWYARPWRPWAATRIEVPQIPQAYQINAATLVVHPALVAQLRKDLPRG